MTRKIAFISAIALACTQSCATCYFMSCATKDTRAEHVVGHVYGPNGVETITEPGPSGEYVLAASFGVIWLPCAIAWDLVTWPVQIIAGYHPFGDKGKRVTSER